MTIAVISDIHSNLQAFEEALRYIEQFKIDEIHCLGDIVGYGGNPNECVELVRKRCAKVVKGNHDLATIDLSHSKFHPEAGKMTNAWTFKILTEENRRYLAWLPFRIVNSDFTLVHASPESPFDWKYIDSVESASEQFGHFSTPVCFVGHTHVPYVIGEDLKSFTLTRSTKFIINVGSIGQPRDGNPQLSFGVIDTVDWTYENIRADYDIEGATRAIARAGLPAILGSRLERGI
jgi:diadenosine tetraphosphatase ApaH/serine/threonine PP2A family protein phosphatase